MSCPINTYKNNTYNEIDIEIINGYHNAVVNDLLEYDKFFSLEDGKLVIKESNEIIGNDVKNGVIDVFDENKELSKIGTQQQYSQYLQQNPNGNIEQFKSWVEEFNRNKSNLDQQSQDKTVNEIYKENPYLENFINSITDQSDDISIYKVKNILDKHGEGRIVKLNKILYNAINRLWDNNIFAKNNIKIKFVDSLPENAVGNFNRDDNEITIDKRKFLNNVINNDKSYPIFYLGYILNHEIIHYLTPKDLSLKIEYADRALEGRFGNTFELEHERKFGKNIKELYDIAIKELSNDKDYGLVNLAEFVAEAMSNPSFQEKLASIPFKSSKQSLWKRFVEILSAYLSLDTKKPITDTLLEAVIAETTNYITENSNIQRTYKRRNSGKTESIDIGYDFLYTTQKNITSLSNFISQKSQENNSFQQFQQSLNKPNTNPILQGNQEAVITPNDKIVFGHPGIGKTFAKKSNNFIDVDEDYKEEHTMQKILRANAKNTGKKEDLKEWEDYVTTWWNKVKDDAKKSGKQIFVSNLPILRLFPQDFDKVINISKAKFIERAKQRNDYKQGETEDWKNSLDIEIAKINRSKVVNTEEYLSDLFTNTQQEQAKKFAELQERLNNKEFLEGAKNAFESSEELQNAYYEASGIGKFRVTLGKELNPEQKFGSQGEPVVKKFEVLDEHKKVIGTVVLDIAKDGSITAHPTLTTIGKGYGQELYQIISLTFGAPIIEWGPHNISKSPEGKKLWNSLEKKGLAKAKYQWDDDLYLRGIDLSQQKQDALNAYTDYIARVSLGIIKNPSSGDYNYTSKVKDIVYHATNVKFDVFKIEDQIKSIFFAPTKEEAWSSKGDIIIQSIVNIKNPKRRIDNKIIEDYENKIDGTITLYTQEYINNLSDEERETAEIFQEIVVSNPKQIHILGSKQDIEGFKTYIKNNQDNKTFNNVDDIISAIKSVNHKYNANVITFKDNGQLDIDVSIIEDEILPDNTIYFSKSLSNIVTGKEDIDSFKYKLDILQKSLPRVEVVFDNTIEGKGKIESKNGKIKLSVNTDSWTTDTLIHEFGHLYIDILLNDGYNNLIANGINQLKGSKLWNEVASRYPDLDEITLGKEVLATAIGLNGAELAESLQNPTLFNKITSIIESILNAIKRLVGLDVNIARELARDLLTNNVLSNNVNSIIPTFQEYYSRKTQEQIIDTLTEHAKHVRRDENHRYILTTLNPDGTYSQKYADESVTSWVKSGIDADFAEIAKDAARYNLGIKVGDNITKEQQQAIENEAEKIQETWVTGSTLGTNIHALFEDLFSKGAIKQPSEYFLANYTINRQTGKSSFENLSPEMIEQHENNFYKLVRVLENIKSRHPGGKFFVEYQIFELLGDHVKAGAMDLLVINPDGTASIYDFKTSINPVYEVVNSKQKLTSSYVNNMFEKHAKQLYAYGALLKKNFNIDAVDFNIIPIHLDIESNDVYKASVSNIGPQKFIEINSYERSKSIREGVNIEFKVEPSFKVEGVEALKKVSKYLKTQIDTTNTFIKSTLTNRTADINLDAIRRIANDLETYEGLDAIVINITHLQKLYTETREKYRNLLIAYNSLSNQRGKKIPMRVEDKLQLMNTINYMEAISNSTTEMEELIKVKTDEIDIKNDILTPLNTLSGQIKSFKLLLNKEILDDLAYKLADKTKIGKHEYRQRYEKEFQELNKLNTTVGLAQTFYIGTEEVSKNTWLAARKDYVANKFKENYEEIYNNALKVAKAYVTEIPFDIQVEWKVLEAGEFNNEIIKYIYTTLKDADINVQQAYISKRNETINTLAEVLTPEQQQFFAQFSSPEKLFSKFIKGDHLVTKYKDDFLYSEDGFFAMKRKVAEIDREIKKALANNDTELSSNLTEAKKNYQKNWFTINTMAGPITDGKKTTIPALKWLNPQWSAIQKNPNDLALYNVLLNLVVSADSIVSNNQLKLTTNMFNAQFIKLPAFAKKTHEILTGSNTWNNMKESVRQSSSKDVSDTDFQLDSGINPADETDTMTKMQEINGELVVETDVNGKLVPNINFPYRGLLGNTREEHTKNISHNLIASLLANYHVSYNYYEKSKLKDDILLIMSALQDSRASGTTSRGNSEIASVFDIGNAVNLKGLTRAVKKSDIGINEETGKLENSDNTYSNPQLNETTRWFQALNSVVEQRLLGIKLTGNFWAHKVAGTTNTITAITKLAFNMPSSIANYSQGIYAIFIESGLGTVIDQNSVFKAVGQSFFKENIVELFDTINSPVPTTKNGILLDRFNARDTSSNPDFFITQKNTLFRNLNMGLLSITDRFVNAIMSNINMLSVLYSIKLKNSQGQYVDKNNKVVSNVSDAISFYDAISYKDNQILFKDLYLPTGEKIDSSDATKIIQKRISEINFKTQGYYQRDGVIEYKRQALGKSLFSMKSWTPSLIKRRLNLIRYALKGNLDVLRDIGYINYNEELETEDVGYSSEAINHIVSSFKDHYSKEQNKNVVLKILNSSWNLFFRNTDNFNKLNYDAQRRVITSNRTSVYLTLSGMMISLMYSLLFAEFDDDEKEEFEKYVINNKKKQLKEKEKFLKAAKTEEEKSKLIDNINVLKKQIEEGLNSDYFKKYYFNNSVPSIIAKNNKDKYKKEYGDWFNRQLNIKYSELEMFGIKPFIGNDNNLITIDSDRKQWDLIFSLAYLMQRVQTETAQFSPEAILPSLTFESGGPSPLKILSSPISATGLIKDSEVVINEIFGLLSDEPNDVYQVNKRSKEFPSTFEHISYTPKDDLIDKVLKHWKTENYEQLFKTVYAKDKAQEK